MRINTYNLELDCERKNMLVKESSTNYTTEMRNIKNPVHVVNIMNNVFGLYKKAEEYMYMICMTTKGKPIGFFEISKGTVSQSMASPREIFIRALLCGASSIILVHNHPSGDPTPSQEDISVTKTIKQVSDIVDIPLFDHIIIGEIDNGNERYVSLMERGII